MRRWTVGAALLVVLGTLAGCYRVVEGPPAPPQPLDVLVQLHLQAGDELARWSAALAAHPGGVPLLVGEPFGQVGAWEPGQPHLAESLYAGLFDLRGPFVGAAPPPTTVRWPHHRSTVLSGLSAADALNGLPVRNLPCPGCRPLSLTDPHLSTATVETTWGAVTMPVWEYTVLGSAVRLTRPALALPTIEVTPPPWDANHPRGGHMLDAAWGSMADRTVSVTFTGAGAASQPCGADYTGEAVESDTAIVVIIHEFPSGGADQVCDLVGHPRTVTATLTRPLGERAVLDEQQGLPAPMIRLS